MTSPAKLTLFTPDGHGSYTTTDGADTERWGLLVRNGDRRVEYVIAADAGPRWVQITTVEQDGWWVRDTDSIERTTLGDVLAATAGKPGLNNLSLSYHALDASYQAVRDFRWGHADHPARSAALVTLAYDLLTALWEHDASPGLADRIARSQPPAVGYGSYVQDAADATERASWHAEDPRR